MSLDDQYLAFQDAMLNPPPAPPINVDAVEQQVGGDLSTDGAAPAPAPTPAPAPAPVTVDPVENMVANPSSAYPDGLPSLTNRTPSKREDVRFNTIEYLMGNHGLDLYKARRMSEQLWGNPDGDFSNTLFGMGLSDFLGGEYVFGVDDGVRQVKQGLETGSAADVAIGSAVAGLSSLEGIPLAGAGVKVARKAMTSDAVQDFFSNAVTRFNNNQSPIPVGMSIEDAGKGALVPAQAAPAAQGSRAHKVPHQLLVVGTGEKPLTPVTQSFSPANKQANIENITTTKLNHPEALASESNWNLAMQDSLGGDFTVAAPQQAIAYVSNPQMVADKISKLTPELKVGVDKGFAHVEIIKNIYQSGNADERMTGNLFTWGILSRGAGPVQQEAAFIDIIDAAAPFIDAAIGGKFDAKMLTLWEQKIGKFGDVNNLPEGSPARQVTMNVNAAGKLLMELSKPHATGGTNLSVLHNMISDFDLSGPQVRRSFMEMTDKAGIDNKVVSFTLLVSGRNDLLVMDRIQSRHLWDDGRYEGKNIYDGFAKEGSTAKEGLHGVMRGPRGLLLTEMLEDGMKNSVAEGYRLAGREGEGSLGRFPWESWVIEGEQVVSHDTLAAIPTGNPIGHSVTEGKRGTFSSGTRYIRGEKASVIEYPLSDGSVVYLSPPRQKEFEAFIKNPKNGIVPKGFKVSQATEVPWYELPGINREKLDDAARQYENAGPDGTIQSGS